jgi:hypothetical protein
VGLDRRDWFLLDRQRPGRVRRAGRHHWKAVSGVPDGLVVVAVHEVIVGEPVGFLADLVDSGGGDRRWCEESSGAG